MYKAREFGCCLGKNNSQSFNHFYINTVKFKVLDLFAGIGGFTLGLHSTGEFETVQFVEIDNFCQKVLAKNWPEIPVHNDIKTYNCDQHIDVITGGFPCQDISECNQRTQLGVNGEKSGLWSELWRQIRDIRPKYAVVENVSNLLVGERGQWFGRVLGDLAEIGYDVEWRIISAADAGAPHERQRLWIVANANGEPHREHSNNIQFPNIPGRHRQSTILQRAHEIVRNTESQNWADSLGGFGAFSGIRHPADYFKDRSFPKPLIQRKDDGFSNRTHRHKALGNAVVPQITASIGQAIIEFDRCYYDNATI